MLFLKQVRPATDFSATGRRQFMGLAVHENLVFQKHLSGNGERRQASLPTNVWIVS